MKQTSRHIAFEKLADLAEELLPAEEREAARAHVEQCSRCAGQLGELTKLMSVMRSDSTEEAPRDVVYHIISLFKERRAHAPEKSLARRLLAALTFDSAEMMPAFGVRSAAQTEARQLLFNAGETDVDVRVTPSGEEWLVSGQVLSASATSGRVELEGETGKVTVALNDNSEFTLPPVSAGSYTLRILLADVEIEVPQFNLGI